MDGDRFDALARLAGRRLGRRAALTGALAALLGGGNAAAKQGKAKPTRVGWPCRGDADCGKRQRCVRANADALSGYCKPAGERCGGLTEFCGADQPCCGDFACRMVRGGERVCLPRAKPLGARCQDPAECEGGRCARGRCRCAAGLRRCGPECVDAKTDPRHCGGCGKACPAGERCAGGRCVTGGGGGWGWGGNACSFPTDAGFCWGWPFAQKVTIQTTATGEPKRFGDYCQAQSANFDCPLCAPMGSSRNCQPLDDPTWEQAERFCRRFAGPNWDRVDCRREDCTSGERYCIDKNTGKAICAYPGAEGSCRD